MKRFDKTWALIGAAFFLNTATPAFAEADVAIKTYREIFESLAVSTRVTPEKKHLDAFTLVRDVLPKFGDIDELNGPMGMAVARLSGLFCQSMIDQDATKAAADRRAHKSVDFAKGPKDMTVAIRTEVAHSYARIFWQSEATPKEVSTILGFMEKSSANATDTAAATRTVLLGACTAAASSLDFLAI